MIKNVGSPSKATQQSNGLTKKSLNKTSDLMHAQQGRVKEPIEGLRGIDNSPTITAKFALGTKQARSKEDNGILLNLSQQRKDHEVLSSDDEELATVLETPSNGEEEMHDTC